MTKRIAVWYDDTSDADAPAWCVSLCQQDGGEIVCLSSHDDKAKAVSTCRKEAKQRGLAAIELDKYGIATALS